MADLLLTLYRIMNIAIY